MAETDTLTATSPAGITAALESALNEVLERMFFVEPTDAIELENPSPEIAVCVPYDGGVTGWLQLRTGAAAARALAADFLASAEEELAESTVSDVFCELANMICGAALSRMQPSAAIRLGRPRVGTGKAPPAPVASCCVATGRGIVTATLSTEEPVCLPDEKRGS